ncbi:hypothetical protein QBC42DRAFT_187852 [Cladorrhinum samala]|uniref:F-box domain-containing protein n=1 Tax=Cladorrhinum samala TaxID=585594 RepID=A0AAV9H9J0_9PEZI|nr:hypothetical protein QBC42DRAFT_187852 [Cladorrhinum samala]
MSSLASGSGTGRDAHRTEDLDPVELDVQLASKTSHLTLSSPGTEAGGSRTDEENLGLDTIEQPETTISAAAATRGISSNGQAHIGAGGWREDTRLSLSTSPPPQAVDAPLRTHLDAGEGSRASSDAEAFVSRHNRPPAHFCELPNEVLLHILSFLEVCDLLATSRTSRHLRLLSLAPHLHLLRLRYARSILPPLLSSPSRPSLRDLISRHIVLTQTSFVSRRLSRNLVSIRLARRLAARPSPQALVERCVLPAECVPGMSPGVVVAPAIVARKRAVERERVKDGLRKFVGSVWIGGVRERGEGVRKWEERVGVGRVWRLRRFWEGMGGRGQES